ncbi:MAG TPA: hypothetical protein VF153_01770, partial [Candidatus Limnocylindria bacterium]
MARRQTLAVMLERGDRKVFAVARDWPGWSRSGKTDTEAVEALLAYAPRYAAVVRAARVTPLPPGSDASADVVERHAGGAGTDFGV